jgi:hypothetical protein
MTQEEKDLLFKDLCGRQTYNVKCQVFDDANPYTLSGVLHNKPYSQLYFEELDWKEFDGFVGIEYCKPYLFPMSSMTEEQKEEISKRYNYHNYFGLYIEITNHSEGYWDNDNSCNLQDYLWLEDWYNKNHFDYRGLIDMGLALDATNLNIY